MIEKKLAQADELNKKDDKSKVGEEKPKEEKKLV